MGLLDLKLAVRSHRFAMFKKIKSKLINIFANTTGSPMIMVFLFLAALILLYNLTSPNRFFVSQRSTGTAYVVDGITGKSWWIRGDDVLEVKPVKIVDGKRVPN